MIWLLMIVGSFSNERCDAIELNHFHDQQGRPVFDQLIFWKWHEGYDEYHVRHWMMFEQKLETVALTKNYTSGDHTVRWVSYEHGREHSVSSRLLFESWTQTDPERQNKKLLPEVLREKLVHRIQRDK